MPRCPLCRSALVTIGFGLYPIAICTSCGARWIQDGRQQLPPERTRMVIHFPPARLRHNSDQPTAITNVLVATSGSSHTGDIPLGTPTCSARSRRGRWALYPSGEQVVVVWPGGALTGPHAEVAGELDRLGAGQDALDRGAAWAIRQFLTDPATADTAPWSSTRARTWSTPAIGYWLSGATNQPGHHTRPPVSGPGAPRSVPPLSLPDPSPQPTPARAA